MAQLYNTFDENKFNSYDLEKRQLKCATFQNVVHRPPDQAPWANPPPDNPLSLNLQTVSLVQGIVGKQRERQVDYDVRRKQPYIYKFTPMVKYHSVVIV